MWTAAGCDIFEIIFHLIISCLSDSDSNLIHPIFISNTIFLPYPYENEKSANRLIYFTNHDNNILPQGAGGRALTQSETLRRVVIIMSTYEELSLIISVALLIVAILNYTHKK